MKRRYLNATTITWALLHIVLVLVGLVMITTDFPDKKALGEISASLGVSIMATGIVGIFLFLYVAISETTRERLRALNEAGVAAVHRHRSVRIKEEYDQRLQNAKEIDLVGYGLGSFLEDYEADFAKWSRQAKVRIVAVDPGAPGNGFSFADARDLEEGRDAGKTKGDVARLIKAIQENSDIDRSRLSLRLMKSIPSVNVMRIDDEIFWGPYLLAQQSRNTFTMVVRRGGFMFEALHDHFLDLWEHHTSSP